jgi:hypothetical protein
MALTPADAGTFALAAVAGVAVVAALDRLS